MLPPMKQVLLHIAGLAVLAALPLSWWLAGRGASNAGVRQMREGRASMDRLTAGTGFAPPPGGGT